MILCVIYSLAAIASFLVLMGYCKTIKNRDVNFILLYISVFVVNSGYFLLSISNTLGTALMANRFAYLGSVMLPLCMMLIMMDVCHIGDKKQLKGIFIGISIVIFCIAASQGFCGLYYEDVSLTFIDGAAKLIKVYGPLHIIYYIYLFSYLIIMAGMILFSSLKKKVFDMKYAALLLVVVFGNIVIWLVEQFIDTDFEFLSVSYIITEMLLLLIYGMVEDRTIITEVMAGRDSVALDREHLSRQCSELNVLTDREWEVVIAILHDKKRREIAEELNVTEHTIKKHTAHIFAKLEVTNRKELHDKLGIK